MSLYLRPRPSIIFSLEDIAFINCHEEATPPFFHMQIVYKGTDNLLVMKYPDQEMRKAAIDQIWNALQALSDTPVASFSSSSSSSSIPPNPPCDHKRKVYIGNVGPSQDPFYRCLDCEIKIDI